MARQRTIVGIGDSVLVEHPDRSEPAGIAAKVARAAVALGHRGIAISRIGQDQAGAELCRLLEVAGVDTTCFQHDPDLPTARALVRPLGDRIERHLDDRSAYDNLQSDFDLEDIAHQADAVVFGLLTRRSGQTRSEEDRFIAQCKAAIKVFDLTHRGDEEPHRSRIESGLQCSDGAIVDGPALRAILPAASGDLTPDEVQSLMHSAHLSFVIAMHESKAGTKQLVLHAKDQSMTDAIPIGMHHEAVVGLLAGLLRGMAMDAAFTSSMEIARYVHAHPDTPIPEHLRD